MIRSSFGVSRPLSSVLHFELQVAKLTLFEPHQGHNEEDWMGR
jgi:hypothetical protein